jgi:hypothetical protein
MKITEVAFILGLLFAKVKVVHYIILTKTYWAMYILGDFFTNSSGHPHEQPTFAKASKCKGTASIFCFHFLQQIKKFSPFKNLLTFSA